MRNLTILAAILAVFLWASSASAFCGFYVSGADAELYNNATMVSLMREGNRTVLAMQNNYEGPPKDFAMVVPVPQVLEKKQVKTLPDDVFDSVDKLTAPRLVEYWERDPCYEPPRRRYDDKVAMSAADPMADGGSGGGGGPPKVKVEAKFKVGEYEIVVLSSTESTALEDWLKQNEYNIPDGAAPYFRPYIEKGQYFFVAKVNMEKVQYQNGQAILSPIRFYYDSKDFVLPVRLGLINSKGAQDLIVFILARGQRYEVANFPNVTIPTNLPVKPSTADGFAGFYGELFDNVLKETPQAVVTEYAWESSKCDPCPKQPLRPDELATLGADVISFPGTQRNPWGQRRDLPQGQFPSRGWVLTRLHTRYAKTSLGEDLVFKAAPPIRGGRGMPQGKQGELPSDGAQSASQNRFQGRYVIRHFWEGDVDCENPRHGVWGGRGGRGQPDTNAAGGLAYSGQKKQATLASFVDTESVSGLKQPATSYDEPAGDVIASWGTLVEPPDSPESKDPDDEGKPKGGCAGGSGSSGIVVIVLLGWAVVRRR